MTHTTSNQAVSDGTVTALGDEGGISFAVGPHGRYYVNLWQYEETYKLRGDSKIVDTEHLTICLPPEAIEGLAGLANGLARLIPSGRPGPDPIDPNVPPGPHKGWAALPACDRDGCRLARLVDAEMDRRGMTDTELGAACGVKPETVNGWRLGRNVPRTERVLNRAADKLGLDRSFLFGAWLGDKRDRAAR